MPHLVLALMDCRASLGDGSDNFEVVAAIYGETKSFNRRSALSQLSQGRLPTILTVVLIGREPKNEIITVNEEKVDNLFPRARWTRERYVWTCTLGVRGYSGLPFRNLKMDLLYDLKNLVIAILASTFDVAPDRALMTKDLDLNLEAGVYNNWKGALTPRARSSI